VDNNKHYGKEAEIFKNKVWRKLCGLVFNEGTGNW